jgi:cytochrome c
MKKTILMLSIAAFCFSCGGGSGEKSGGTAGADNGDIDKGLALIGKSDCFGCHKIKEASIGPAYNLIGQKYENTEANINTLAEKVQKGGSGNWGQVPMAGHTGVSKEDAVLMVKYVLSLKDEK